ncbi:sodium:solute symporter family protein [bacterium]|nr:sodium:solute symporter family protein [bacterium]
MESGLRVADFVVIGVYFALVIGIGVWASRRVKDQEDYFVAGRRFGKLVQVFTSFGAGTSVESPVGVATTTFTNGAAGIWSSLTYLFVTPIYWIIAPWMRRLRVLTMADYFEERYGSRAIAGLYSLVAATVLMTHLSVGFHAASKTVMALAPKSYQQLTPAEQREYAQAGELQELRERDYQTLSRSEKERMEQLLQANPRTFYSHISRDMLIWIVCLIVLIYGVSGGLAAAALTDTLQGMCIIVLTVMLFPFCWSAINAEYGGEGVMDALRTVHARLPESFFQILGAPSNVDFTWYYIAALSLLAVVNTPAQAHFLTTHASAKNEFVCRVGAMGAYIKRFCAVLWGFFALCALALYSDKINDPDLMWGYATSNLLQPVGFGLIGLMIACLMAALMSTADTLMISAAGLLTRNVYRPLVAGRGEKHYVLVGRIAGTLVVVTGAVVATRFDTILQMLKFMWEINVVIAATWWLGFVWRRANRAGAWSSMALAATFFFLLPLLLPMLAPSLRSAPYLLKTTAVRSVVQTYRAHAMDVEARQKEIGRWEALSEAEKSATPAPRPLAVGESFTRTVVLPAKSIFWTKGLDRSGRGTGMLSLELVALDRLGFDLSRNTYAMNETLRILLRTLLPFLILILVSSLTRPEGEARLDRFFVKMRTRVKENRAEDAREMELSYASPDRFSEAKLFPRSNWEFLKWTREDGIGFLAAVALLFAVLGFLQLLVSLGG